MFTLMISYMKGTKKVNMQTQHTLTCNVLCENMTLSSTLTAFCTSSTQIASLKHKGECAENRPALRVLTSNDLLFFSLPVCANLTYVEAEYVSI